MSNHHRRYTNDRVEARLEGDTPVISGYAAVFNEEATIGGMFREVIRPGAFRHMVENPPAELKALFNHDPNEVLGGTNSGTLRISEDDRGLRYEVDINADDPRAMSVLAKVRRGDINKSSFGFMVPEGGQERGEHESGKLPLRVITRADLFDVSVVTFPAYAGTSSFIRSADETAADDFVAAELAIPLATVTQAIEADALIATDLRVRRQKAIVALGES